MTRWTQPVRVRTFGNHECASLLIGRARKELTVLEKKMENIGLKHMEGRVSFPDGSQIHIGIVYGQAFANLVSPEIGIAPAKKVDKKAVKETETVRQEISEGIEPQKWLIISKAPALSSFQTDHIEGNKHFVWDIINGQLKDIYDENEALVVQPIARLELLNLLKLEINGKINLDDSLQVKITPLRPSGQLKNTGSIRYDLRPVVYGALSSSNLPPSHYDPYPALGNRPQTEYWTNEYPATVACDGIGSTSYARICYTYHVDGREYKYEAHFRSWMLDTIKEILPYIQCAGDSTGYRRGCYWVLKYVNTRINYFGSLISAKPQELIWGSLFPDQPEEELDPVLDNRQRQLFLGKSTQGNFKVGRWLPEIDRDMREITWNEDFDGLAASIKTTLESVFGAGSIDSVDVEKDFLITFAGAIDASASGAQDVSLDGAGIEYGAPTNHLIFSLYCFMYNGYDYDGPGLTNSMCGLAEGEEIAVAFEYGLYETLNTGGVNTIYNRHPRLEVRFQYKDDIQKEAHQQIEGHGDDEYHIDCFTKIPNLSRLRNVLFSVVPDEGPHYEAEFSKEAYWRKNYYLNEDLDFSSPVGNVAYDDPDSHKYGIYWLSNHEAIPCFDLFEVGIQPYEVTDLVEHCQEEAI